MALPLAALGLDSLARMEVQVRLQSALEAHADTMAPLLVQYPFEFIAISLHPLRGTIRPRAAHFVRARRWRSL